MISLNLPAMVIPKQAPKAKPIAVPVGSKLRNGQPIKSDISQDHPSPNGTIAGSPNLTALSKNDLCVGSFMAGALISPYSHSER